MAEGAFAPEHPLELEAARGWIGDRLDDMSGAAAGRVEGIFVDAHSGEPVWLVIRIGRLGRRTAVPFAYAAAGAGGHAWVPYSKPTLRDAPEVDPAVGTSPALELELSDHYGLGPSHPRREQLEGKAAEALSSVPA